MYTLTKKDSGRLIIFGNIISSNVFTTVPKLSNTKSEYLKMYEIRELDQFIKEFNKKYSHKANLELYKGLKVIIVKGVENK